MGNPRLECTVRRSAQPCATEARLVEPSTRRHRERPPLPSHHRRVHALRSSRCARIRLPSTRRWLFADKSMRWRCRALLLPLDGLHETFGVTDALSPPLWCAPAHRLNDIASIRRPRVERQRAPSTAGCASLHSHPEHPERAGALHDVVERRAECHAKRRPRIAWVDDAIVPDARRCVEGV
jgi:hypothetical protein